MDRLLRDLRRRRLSVEAQRRRGQQMEQALQSQGTFTPVRHARIVTVAFTSNLHMDAYASAWSRAILAGLTAAPSVPHRTVLHSSHCGRLGYRHRLTALPFVRGEVTDGAWAGMGIVPWAPWRGNLSEFTCEWATFCLTVAGANLRGGSGHCCGCHHARRSRKGREVGNGGTA